MKILIAVPTYENICPDTFKSIYEIDKGDHDIDFNFFRGYDVANARNQIGKYVLDNEYDYCLMVDSDEVIPKHGLLDLLETEQSYPLGHCLVVGYCLSGHNNKDGRTTVFKWGGKDYVYEDAYFASELKEFCDNGINKVQIRGCGLGSALIHRSVFEEISYPWFQWLTYESGSQLSEDLYFCEMLPGIKMPMFVDTRVNCGHMMRHIDYC